MTVVTTADTSQLYALAARHGLKLHGPLTVNELGLDYRIVIATVDDGRRWVLRIPRRAEVSAKVEPEARVLAMLKNRLPFAVPDSTGDSYDNAMAESINGLYKAEVIHRKSWKNRAEVELATLTWVDWYNNRRLLVFSGLI